MYKLEYWNGTVLSETIIWQAPKPVCFAKKKTLIASGRYSYGKFKIEKV